jgi:hypothetical protein
VKPVPPAAPPRLALTVAEAASAVGLSESCFRRHCLPDLKVVRAGTAVVVSVPELAAWLERAGSLGGPR